MKFPACHFRPENVLADRHADGPRGAQGRHGQLDQLPDGKGNPEWYEREVQPCFSSSITCFAGDTVTEGILLPPRLWPGRRAAHDRHHPHERDEAGVA